MRTLRASSNSLDLDGSESLVDLSPLRVPQDIWGAHLGSARELLLRLGTYPRTTRYPVVHARPMLGLNRLF